MLSKTTGSLGRMKDNLSDRSYNYNYDPLGRLISFTEQYGGSGIQRMRAGYDTSNRLISTEYALSPALNGSFNPAKAYGYTYRDADGSLASMTLPGNGSLAYTYDALKRLTARQLKCGDDEVINRSFTYLPGAGENGTTLMVSSLKNARGGDVYSEFAYKYDAAGNILEISGTRNRKEKTSGGTIVITSQTKKNYVYDEQGQLVKEYSYSLDPDNNDRDAYGLNYSYDAAGNLLSWCDSDGSFILSYNDADWPDLLTAFNGKPITYDAIGNPTLWHDGTAFTWVNGRRLASAVNSTKSLNVSYAYNVDGLRMSKTVNGVEHKYIWQGGKLVSEYFGGKELEFFYDESGKPCAMSCKASADAEPQMFYYVTNLQGDVLSMVDAEGFSAAEYYYNAWGLPMGSTGAMAEINPLRYRGYYFDAESGLYYLKSRYYDPFTCRFINADEYISTGHISVGTNMFAYCNNNPMMYVDSNGDSPLVAAIVVGVLVGGLVGAAYGAINARAAGEDVGIGALNGAFAGAIAGGVAGAVAIAGPLVKVGAVLFNASAGAYFDYRSQRQQYDNKAANVTASGEFKVDVGSMVIAGASAAVGTGLNIGLTTAGTVTETIVTGITGGYFGSLAAGAVEMMGRGMYILSGQQSFKGAVKAKTSDFRSQRVFVKCRA